MALAHSPSIVTNGLVELLDVENLKSYGGVNLIRNSNSFSTTGWGNQNVTATQLSGQGPFGGTATRIAETITTGQHLLVYNVGAVTIGETFTWSASFKGEANTNQIVLHAFGEGAVVFNLTGSAAGTVASISGVNTLGSSITPEPNGWYRCAATFRRTNTTGNFYVGNQQGLGSYAGNTDRTYLVANAQLQTSSRVTAYQETTGTEGSRLIWRDLANAGTTTLTGNPFYDGSVKAMNFNGTSAYITVSPTITLNSTAGWSIGMWIRANATQANSGWNYFIFNNNYEIGTFGTISGDFILKDLGAVGTPAITTPTITSGWNYLVFGITATQQGFYKLYRSSGYTESATGNGVFRNNIDLSIDRMFNRSGGSFYGALCPIIQIYNRPLSTDEVTQNYNALKGRFGL